MVRWFIFIVEYLCFAVKYLVKTARKNTLLCCSYISLLLGFFIHLFVHEMLFSIYFGIVVLSSCSFVFSSFHKKYFHYNFIPSFQRASFHAILFHSHSIFFFWFAFDLQHVWLFFLHLCVWSVCAFFMTITDSGWETI